MTGKKNVGGLEEMFKTKQSKYVQKMWDKISKNIERNKFNQHRSMKIQAGPNHLEGREVEKWGLLLQHEWELMLGKVEGEENGNA